MLTSINNFRTKIVDINSYLLIAFGFLLPMTVAGGNIFAGLIFLLFLIEGKYKQRFKSVKNNKLVWAILAFVGLHAIGLLWSEDLKWGVHILGKELILLYIPIFMMYIKKQHIQYYLSVFLLSMFISEIISYSIWFEIIDVKLVGSSASVDNPTPFMSHISYNPYLAIAIYIILYKLFFDCTLSNIQKILYAFFFLTMTINMFITGGRAGQVMYFVMLIIITFQFFNKQLVKAFIVSIFAISLISSIAYNTSKIFHDGVNKAFNNTVNYKTNPKSSVGYRISYNINSFEIFQSSPIFGVGTGDFKKEYKKIHIKNETKASLTENPHTMYGLILAQLGLIGLISLIYILLTQIAIAKKSNNDLVKKFGFTLPVLFGVIMFSESYLLGHFTTMLFIFLSAILYKDYETN